MKYLVVAKSCPKSSTKIFWNKENRFFSCVYSPWAAKSVSCGTPNPEAWRKDKTASQLSGCKLNQSLCILLKSTILLTAYSQRITFTGFIVTSSPSLPSFNSSSNFRALQFYQILKHFWVHAKAEFQYLSYHSLWPAMIDKYSCKSGKWYGLQCMCCLSRNVW